MLSFKRSVAMRGAAMLLLAGAVGIQGCEDGSHDHGDHDHGSHSHPASSASDASYPLKTCVVSGEKLGDHGSPYELTHDGVRVLLCCESCLADFKAAPAKFLAKIREATTSTAPAKP